MRFHCMAVILVLFWCCFFDPEAAEFAVVILCFGLVLALECVNTAVEALSDKLTGERHPLIKIAKDAAAGAVAHVGFAQLFADGDAHPVPVRAVLSGVKHQKAVGNAGGAIQAPENMVELQAG